MRHVLFIGLGLALAGCVTAAPPEVDAANELMTEPVATSRSALNPLEDPVAELAAWFSGYYRNRAQATSDPAFAEIELHVVPIWPGRTDGRWFYVEQGAVETSDAPDRQRVYRLTTGPDGVIAEVYAFRGDAERHVGAWMRSNPLLGVTPDVLDFRDGCTLYFERRPNRTYEGRTRGQTCVSRLRGASYATTELTVGQEGLVRWDRGMTHNGVQVWGPAAGPYRFDRIED